MLVAWACARWGEHRPEGITIGATPIATVPPEAQKYLDELVFRPKPDANASPPAPTPAVRPFSATGPAPTPSPLLSLPQQTGMFNDPNSGKPVEQMTGLEMEERGSLGCTRREFTRWRDRRVMGFSRTHAQIDFGFPFRSLGYAERYSYSISGGVGAMRIPGLPGGWPIAPTERRQEEWTYLRPQHIYPLAPLPIGFAANSAIYAGALSMLLFVASMARRALRGKRGLCRKCGYPIGVSPVCTECGARIVPQTR